MSRENSMRLSNPESYQLSWRNELQSNHAFSSLRFQIHEKLADYMKLLNNASTTLFTMNIFGGRDFNNSSSDSTNFATVQNKTKLD